MRNQWVMGEPAQHRSHKTDCDTKSTTYNILILGAEALGFFMLMAAMVNVYVISDILDSILMGVR